MEHASHRTLLPAERRHPRHGGAVCKPAIDGILGAAERGRLDHVLAFADDLRLAVEGIERVAWCALPDAH